MDYNSRSRNANAILASASGVIQQIAQILGSFLYRTIFLMILSKEYLGISSLFANILQLFSLAELGIGSAIQYSMYKPFAQHDTKKIGSLIHFYKRIYHGLAILVAVMGVGFYPFLDKIVNVSEIPSDVNLTLVYFLFVAQSIVSYLFVYKQSLLMADQQAHMVALFSGGLQFATYGVKILLLIWTRDFELSLFGDILSNLLLNWAFSLWITKKYSGVFKEKTPLPKEDRAGIFKHTTGLLCHRIGYVIVSSTDNIILTKYVGLVAVGIYSTYATITLAISNIVNRIITSLVPTIANYLLKKTKEESYDLFKRVLFINLWLSCFTTVCLYVLLNPFIEAWLNDTFLLSQFVVAWICLQHYLQTARQTAYNFVCSCGLFYLDKARPLIEGSINLAVSIVLAKWIGIAGVFIGTCLSGLLTYYWREPYLMHKRFFQRRQTEYWLIQIFWFVLTLALCWLGRWVIGMIGNGPWNLIAKFLIAIFGTNLIILLVTFRTKEFRSLFAVVRHKLPFFKHR